MLVHAIFYAVGGVMGAALALFWRWWHDTFDAGVPSGAGVVRFDDQDAGSTASSAAAPPSAVPVPDQP